jgi:hypothetical protein
MATLRDTSALNALNEKDYINKLYDTNTDTTKKLLQQNFTDNTGFLNTEQNRVQQQTQDNVNRTQVEAQTAQSEYNGPRLSYGGSQQAALSRENALQANTGSLRQQQNDADMEIERQRQLMASQFSAAIKQAQEENDMAKAQQLYNAAKAEEEKLLALKRTGSTMLAEAGDTSVRDSLLNGETPVSDYSGQTWEQVFKNEQAVNDIYDNQLESQLLSLQMENDKAVSDLEAKRRQQQAETDSKLTDAYVDGLRKLKNYQEVQTAYGQGSGTAAAARIAGDTELQRNLTDLRRLQMEADADTGMQLFDIFDTYRKRMDEETRDINRQRAEALFKAADDNENNLYETQLQIGQELAKDGDYSILGKLYGWTQDQIDRVANAHRSSGGGGGGGSSSGSGPTKKQKMEREVALATVTDNQGNARENSAYWNSQKKQAYYGML